MRHPDEIVWECEGLPRKELHLGTVVAPNGSRAVVPIELHGPVACGLYGLEVAA